MLKTLLNCSDMLFGWQNLAINC